MRCSWSPRQRTLGTDHVSLRLTYRSSTALRPSILCGNVLRTSEFSPQQEFLQRRWERQRACPDSLSLSVHLSLALSLSISEECPPLCQHIDVKTGVEVGVVGRTGSCSRLGSGNKKDIFVNHESAGRRACEMVVV